LIRNPDALSSVRDRTRPRIRYVRVARLFQKRSRLSVPPNKVANIVRSASKISPARVPLGGIQRNELNSRFAVSDDALGGKWLELLEEIAPRVARVAIVFNPAAATYTEFWLNSFKAAAASFAVEAIAAPVRDLSELESVVAAQAREPNGGLIVMPDSFTDAHRVEITSLVARYRLPAVYAYRFFAVFGGLLSYGPDLTDNFRRAATYADRILKGEKPADLPVQAPTKYELVINLKTAKALGLEIPPKLLAIADEVIE
jgi:putative tryptophan/tyrosine transport system substrate-binding protein